MVDLAMLQVVRDLVAIFGVIAGFTYYVLTVRNSQRMQKMTLETRQAQLFMHIYSQWNSMEMSRNYQRVMDMPTDYEDFLEKTDADIESGTGWRTMGRFFEGIGVLVHRGLIDVTFVDDLMSGATMRYWEKIAPVVKESRIRDNFPQMLEWVEYLYNQIKPIVEEQHPELKT